jgi:hypothetical protein
MCLRCSQPPNGLSETQAHFSISVGHCDTCCNGPMTLPGPHGRPLGHFWKAEVVCRVWEYAEARNLGLGFR